MKPSALRIERLLVKVEAARPRRYCFHFDEVAEGRSARLALRARTKGFEPRGMGEEILPGPARCGLAEGAAQRRSALNARCWHKDAGWLAGHGWKSPHDNPRYRPLI